MKETMTVLVLGATGATGRLLVQQLLDRGLRVKAIVRSPDSLLDSLRQHEYELHPSPTRSAIFNPARTSRINVAHFMADLITNHDAWEKWKGQMPVIYNKEPRLS